jgi:hypothetical protein
MPTEFRVLRVMGASVRLGDLDFRGVGVMSTGGGLKTQTRRESP